MMAKKRTSRSVRQKLNEIKNKRLKKHPFCHYCNAQLSKKSATVEHVVPISRGGKLFDERNIVLACFNCNSKKGSKILEEM